MTIKTKQSPIMESISSGLYLVTLNNDNLISVNANDPRLADKAIRVNKENCKFGKAKDLNARRLNYFKVFGEHHVNFHPLVRLQEIDLAETAILKSLDEYRVRGSTGRKNEWLFNVSPDKVIEIVFSVLSGLPIVHERLWEGVIKK